MSISDLYNEDFCETGFFDVIESLLDYRGKTPLKLGMSWSDVETPYLALSALNVKDNGIDTTKEAHYGTADLYKKWMKDKPLREQQILMTTEAPAGVVMQIPDKRPYILSQRVIALNVDPTKVDECFFAYLLRSHYVQNQIERLCSGGTAKGISQKHLKEIKVRYPKSIKTQQKIAEFFTALDEKIRCLDDLAKGFSQSMQGVLNKVFTQQISFKDENGNNYSEWTIKKIKDVAPLQRGFDLPTSQLQDGECTVIYSNGQTAKHSAFKCDGCAVVTGRSGTIGKVFYLDNCKYWPHNTTLWVTDFCGNNPKFIYYLFKFVGLERFSTGTGVPTLNRNDVHDYVVKIPSIDEQTKIVEFLDCYNKKLNLLISKKHAFHELKKAFMQRMFVQLVFMAIS